MEPIMTERTDRACDGGKETGWHPYNLDQAKQFWLGREHGCSFDALPFFGQAAKVAIESYGDPEVAVIIQVIEV